MAVRKKVAKKAVAKRGVSKAIATMAGWESKLAEMARDESAKEVSTDSDSITWPMGGGTFEYKGSELGNTMSVIIVDSTYVNTFYDRPIDTDNLCPPACFAIGDIQGDMVPDESSPVAQADSCAECEKNEFYSAAGGGKGKACRNGRKLAVLDPEAEEVVAYMNIPPTSIKAYSGHVKKVEAKYKRPVFAVITDLGFDDNVDYAKLTFDFVETIENPEVMQRIMDVRENNAEIMRKPFDVSGYTEPPSRGASKRAPARGRRK